MIFPAILPLLGLVILGRVYLEELKEIEKVMHDHLQLGEAIEHFFDSFPNEWGLLVDTEEEKTEYIKLLQRYCDYGERTNGESGNILGQ